MIVAALGLLSTRRLCSLRSRLHVLAALAHRSRLGVLGGRLRGVLEVRGAAASMWVLAAPVAGGGMRRLQECGRGLLFVLAGDALGQCGRHERTNVNKLVIAIHARRCQPRTHLHIVHILRSFAISYPVICCCAQEAESRLKRSNPEIAILPGSLCAPL